MGTRRQMGHGLARFLGIKLETGDEGVSRGESVFSTQTADSFVEEEPTTAEWLAETLPSGKDVSDFVRSLFPFLSWIGFYNLQWFIGDLVAGVTIGCVVVPQGMAYAQLANLPVEFGLYSSFMGVLIYWFFATSKDITIGPVAVVSTVTGNVVHAGLEKLPQYKDSPYIIASALSIFSGAIVLALGVLRLGFIVELLPLVSLSAFMTGSAISIAAGQVPTLLGILSKKKLFNSKDATYLVVINTLKHLGHTDLNAAMGVTALVMLYAIRAACTWLARHNPSKQRFWFFVSTLRTVFVILLYVLISWLVNMNHRDKPKFAILGTVPRGFQHVAVPKINGPIISALISELPATVIVLLIEHIAISKSFGRINNYVINPSQEMVAIGVTNLLGPFLGGFPSTGSFSRTAIKSKAGVRTPFAGVITAVVVLLAIYALPAVFFFIPSASLAAVIIHAVGDLITPPNTLYKFWRVSPLEVLTFFVGVIVTIFSSIEDGIYCTIAISFAVYLFRILKSRGTFLGRVQVQSVLGDHVIGNDNSDYGTFSASSADTSKPASARNIFLPIGHGDGTNPVLGVTNPYPGIFLYRFVEGLGYPNANHTLEHLRNYILQQTRPTNPNRYARPGDRPWNAPGPRAGDGQQEEERMRRLPTLQAIILDFSSVNNVDATAVQTLVDVRKSLDGHAAPDAVDWHLACIGNRWTRRALASAGFGYPTPDGGRRRRKWQSIFSVAEIGGDSSAAAAAEKAAGHDDDEEDDVDVDVDVDADADDQGPLPPLRPSSGGKKAGGLDEIRSCANKAAAAAAKAADPLYTSTAKRRRVAVHGINRPLFHVDLTSALQSAVANVEARAEAESRGGTDVGAEV